MSSADTGRVAIAVFADTKACSIQGFQIQVPAQSSYRDDIVVFYDGILVMKECPG